MKDSLTPLRIFVVVIGLLLPTLILIPLGSLWLWQHGYLIYWAMAALVSTLAAYVFERVTLPKEPAPLTSKEAARDMTAHMSVAADENASSDPLRADAEAVVERLVKETTGNAIGAWNDLLNRGLATVEEVAKVYHPDRQDPMLRFTVPEALTLVENVSGKLKPIFEETIPFGSRLTVAQFAQIYRWRKVYDVAGRAWSLWRVLRVANPATAVTHEMRERLSGSLFGWAKETIAGRFARAYVREVGEAAIDLYSGEMRREAIEGAADTE